jgi:hypothetical protein
MQLPEGWTRMEFGTQVSRRGLGAARTREDQPSALTYSPLRQSSGTSTVLTLAFTHLVSAPCNLIPLRPTYGAKILISAPLETRGSPIFREVAIENECREPLSGRSAGEH